MLMYDLFCAARPLNIIVLGVHAVLEVLPSMLYGLASKHVSMLHVLSVASAMAAAYLLAANKRLQASSLKLADRLG